ncbi:histidine kinase [Mucilaginibacter gracilis]|uniref:Histidine kinase n=1 Tax=Mucilaginibacter gracilis TaxID=423350 RepID=A0A495J6B4_9SPHI|nr:histidine kinase [Mucilaginibacter gracilis]RKR83549.1 histidine kinase [Mucilaginibacter gracilis]
MKKNRLHVYYLLVWACLVLYLYVDNVANNRGSQPYVWSNLMASFAEFSFCFFWVYPRYLKLKKMPLLIAGLILADILFVGCRYLIEEVIYLWLLGYRNYDPSVKALHYLNDNWWRALKPVLFSFIAWSLLDIYRKEKETEQLKQEKIKAELLFLKTQINPHFLYNTLNYLYSLSYPISEKLADAIIKLSQLMRYMLDNSIDGLLNLQQEIDYLQNYIAIYKLRFEENFFVDFKAEGDIGNKKIASLILIPFVENAFKHGVINNEQRPVKIHLKVIESRLSFMVSNKIIYGEKDNSSGIGLANIKRRLELIYPQKFELLITNNGETFKTTLNIKLN